MTLILPETMGSDPRYKVVGKLTRTESDTLVVGYAFDMRTNEIKAERVPNTCAGTEHHFVAHRLRDHASKPVSMRARVPVIDEDRGVAEQ